jgi:translation initiation factor IF-2
VRHKAIAAAMGVRISATGLEGAVAGTPLLRREKEDSLEELKSTGLFCVVVGLFCVGH